MSGKILVPLDGSKLAEIVLPYAEELASRLGYETILINVRSPAEVPYHPVLQSYLEGMVGKIKRNIEDSLAKNKSETTKVESVVVGSGVLVGHPAKGIVEYADKEGVTLIVMATHGRTGVRRWALGSVADKVVRASKQPVMLIRAHTEARKNIRLASIFVPLDGSKQSETVLPYIENLAPKLEAKVVLFHVIAQHYHVYAGTEGVVEAPYTEEELEMKKAGIKEYLEKLGKALQEKGIWTETQVGVGEAAEEIIKLAEELNADIIAMSTHGRSGSSRWEHGSVVEKLLHAGNTPLLLVRAPIDKQGKTARETVAELETVDSLIGDLASNDSVVRVKARRSLVAMGREAVRPLVEALRSKKHWVRWEAAKALAQIGNPTATQALVDALEDEEFDVRWLAAEGLIRIGAESIEPLLKALIERPDSLWLQEGAHRVLHDMDRGDLDDILRPVLGALEDVKPSLEVPSAAEAALDMVKKTTSS
jgi:nucleotide-binding universal stress UspA family protein